MNTEELIFHLTSLDGTSGDEFAAAEAVLSLLPGSRTDKLGNVIAEYNAQGKTRIMLEAHLDRIGFIVTGVDDDGFISLARCGGTDLRTAVGSPVIIYGKEAVCGVISSTPPHLQSGETDEKIKIDNLSVDVGMNKAEVEKLVSIGDRVILKDTPAKLLCGRVSASSLDDRAGVAAVLIAAGKLREKLKNVCLIVALNTREEVGGQGASASTFALEPDYAICVDAGFGIDHNTSGPGTIAMGKGTSIGIAPVLDRKLTEKLISLAKENEIPFQHDVMSRTTGTDADDVGNSKAGVRTALLSVPVTNMHTQVETVCLKDIEDTAKLMECFVLATEAEDD